MQHQERRAFTPLVPHQAARPAGRLELLRARLDIPNFREMTRCVRLAFNHACHT